MVSPDLVYSSTKVSKFINYIMQRGQKETARKIVYEALNIIKEKQKGTEPLEVFEMALKNAGPQMEVGRRAVGNAGGGS